NNLGQIVGYAYTASEQWHATLFDPTGAGNNIDLNTLIDPSLGWELLMATAINDSGWIVGAGSNPAGKTEAFLLKPIPEPLTLVMIAAGTFFLRQKYR
ncbi:MAG: HAF repeat/PEP-CTERM domain-containing protein, partial [Planctomycetota bacterium]